MRNCDGRHVQVAAGTLRAQERNTLAGEMSGGGVGRRIQTYSTCSTVADTYQVRASALVHSREHAPAAMAIFSLLPGFPRILRGSGEGAVGAEARFLVVWYLGPIRAAARRADLLTKPLDDSEVDGVEERRCARRRGVVPGL